MSPPSMQRFVRPCWDFGHNRDSGTSDGSFVKEGEPSEEQEQVGYSRARGMLMMRTVPQ